MHMVKTAAVAHRPQATAGLTIFFPCRLVRPAKSRVSGGFGPQRQVDRPPILDKYQIIVG